MQLFYLTWSREREIGSDGVVHICHHEVCRSVVVSAKHWNTEIQQNVMRRFQMSHSRMLIYNMDIWLQHLDYLSTYLYFFADADSASLEMHTEKKKLQRTMCFMVVLHYFLNPSLHMYVLNIDRNCWRNIMIFQFCVEHTYNFWKAKHEALLVNSGLIRLLVRKAK